MKLADFTFFHVLCIMANSIGEQFRVTSFGESHGPAIGVVIDGVPPGIEIDMNFIQAMLNKRKPGQSSISTQRKEEDHLEIISGVFEGKTTGAPISLIILNTDHKPKDYEQLKNVYRPGHADYTYTKKYGHRDYFGGGRSSARVTAGWVAAGAIAMLYLDKVSAIKIEAIVSAVHNISLPEPVEQYNWADAEKNIVRCPDTTTAEKMIARIEQVKNEKDSVGGIISARILNMPIGLGEPVFNKLNADLAHAMFSINAVKAVQFGSGFESTRLKGSENNDAPDSGSNHDGGITGGISNGQPVRFDIGFKPPSSIGRPQHMLNTDGIIESFNIEGRHDPCVLPRAVAIVEAMTAIVTADHFLRNLKFVQ